VVYTISNWQSYSAAKACLVSFEVGGYSWQINSLNFIKVNKLSTKMCSLHKPHHFNIWNHFHKIYEPFIYPLFSFLFSRKLVSTFQLALPSIFILYLTSRLAVALIDLLFSFSIPVSQLTLWFWRRHPNPQKFHRQKLGRRKRRRRHRVSERDNL
jgi:hypothetical protein